MAKNNPLSTLRGWRWYVWLFWGDRTYSRNSFALSWFVFVLVGYGALALCVLAFNYCPWTLFNIMAITGVSAGLFSETIRQANQQIGAQLFALILGALGYFYQVNLDLTAIYWSLEPYLFAFLALGGALGLMRRAYNNFIWRLLDSIAASRKEQAHG
jgi:hypothetical protein